MKNILSVFAMVWAFQLTATQANADPISLSQFVELGGTYTIAGQNAPTNYSESVTIGDASDLIAGDTLEVSHAFIADGPNAEWVTIRLATVDGGPIGNPSLNWRLDYFGIPFVTPVLWDGVIFYWEEDGAAFDPINSFGGIQYQGNVSPLTGAPVYGGNPFPAVPNLTELDLFTFVNPFSFIDSGGNNASTADAFVIGFHIFVPEPASLTMLGIGLVGLLALGRRTALAKNS